MAMPRIAPYGSHGANGIACKLFVQIRHQFQYIWIFLFEIRLDHFRSGQVLKAIFAVFVGKEKCNSKTAVQIGEGYEHILATRPYMERVFIEPVSRVFGRRNLELLV